MRRPYGDAGTANISVMLFDPQNNAVAVMSRKGTAWSDWDKNVSNDSLYAIPINGKSLSNIDRSGWYAGNNIPEIVAQGISSGDWCMIFANVQTGEAHSGTIIVHLPNGRVYFGRVNSGNITVWSEMAQKGDSFQNKGVITTGDDLNNYANVGFYKYNGAPANIPEGSSTYGVLCVYRTDNYITQLVFDGLRRIYTRGSSNSGSTWSAWLEYTTKGDLTSHIKSGNVTTSADGQAIVNFTTPFSNTPTVVAVGRGESLSVIIEVKVTNISKNGFKVTGIRLDSDGMTTPSVDVFWIATDLGNN